LVSQVIRVLVHVTTSKGGPKPLTSNYQYTYKSAQVWHGWIVKVIAAPLGRFPHSNDVAGFQLTVIGPGVHQLAAFLKRYPAGYDTWKDTNDSWAYERGRQWAQIAPHSLPLKDPGQAQSASVPIRRRYPLRRATGRVANLCPRRVPEALYPIDA
jgi:hypothetical protein